MDNYNTVTKGECELIIEKSKFLGFVVGVDDEDDAIQKLNFYKKKYADATHVCYAYISDTSGNTARFSDNGEPSGTAGAPILEVLKGASLKKTLAVVVRYFGGVKLGTGGLVRAYGMTAKKSLENTSIITNTLCDTYAIELDYSTHKKIAPTFVNPDIRQLSIDYTDNITIVVAIKKGSDFISKLVDKTLGSAVIMLTTEQYINFNN